MFAEKGYSQAIDRSLTSGTEVDSRMELQYFENTVPPQNLPVLEEQVKSFVEFHTIKGNKVAVVTSGGTTVPLENNTVRFIDNFSAGTRGSLSVEYFLKMGYAVLFLHREFSLRPFSHRYSQKSFMDWLEVDNDTGNVVVKPQYLESMKLDLIAHDNAIKNNMLLELPFTTVNQYLYMLRMTGYAMRPLGKRAIFFLAAAVSDFFLPTSRTSEHKIQSRGMAKLVVDLDPVPKILKSLVQEWIPSAMVVSFKLETDITLLLSKCRNALEKYGHSVVIGNLLQTRKDEVYIVTECMEEHVTRDSTKGDVIEATLISKVVQMHEQYIALP